MERGAFSRRDTTPLPTVLLLLVSPYSSCLCFPGYRLKEECSAPRERSNCTACPYGQYMDTMNYADKCRTCRKCNMVFRPCKGNQNTVCQCDKGYYRSNIDSENFECLKCRQCDHPEKEKNNTVCQCEDNYYRLNNKCELCSKCVDLLTRDPWLHRIVLIGKLVFQTKPAAECHFFHFCSFGKQKRSWGIHTRLRLYHTLHLIPLILKTFSKMWKCRPDLPSVLASVSELIYTVLDLVPVLQVKQLVRSLGVRDTEIEQAELDYRPCREAHYQMLRAWAERGSGAGALLHPPLLHDLLNELRKMHLGQAAEELEKVYGFT
uniref:Tumor necrosis factor receptor superfamily, member 1a n=1 Tax=Takifugu rubripes TaxID=31033 RepID=A0A674MSF6_TAKRU